MTTAAARDHTQTWPRARVITYWVTTLLLVTECLVGGVMGGLQMEPFLGTATHLGYPDYFMSILGVWYVAAGLVVVAPRLPRLKEWAYAGLIFNYTGAVASHVWMRDDAATLAGPLFFVVLTAISWALRPPSRRGFRPNPMADTGFATARVIAYWLTTVSVAAELAVGGVWDLLRTDYVSGVVAELRYPGYLLTIMGVWKMAGAVALLVPGLPRTKEWAYAGAVISYTTAVASHVIVGTGVATFVAPTALLALTLISWALRPPARS